MMRRYTLPAIVVLAIAISASPGPAPGATAPGGETLTLQPECSTWPPAHSVTISLDGFPPHTEVSGTAEFPGGGGAGPVTVQTDDNGHYAITIGSYKQGTFRATVEWSGGTLTESRDVNCGGPDGTPYADP